MVHYYFNIGLTYFVVGFGVALVYYFFIDRNVFGRFWGALIIGLTGSYLGALIDYLFKDIIEALANFNGSVNLFPPILTAFIVIAVYSRVSPKR
jgi:uncharacterized membrane protein YeaQ/YmgE (transglycosylase-associated protein family)